jgi:hypothetical protein
MQGVEDQMKGLKWEIIQELKPHLGIDPPAGRTKKAIV